MLAPEICHASAWLYAIYDRASRFAEWPRDIIRYVLLPILLGNRRIVAGTDTEIMLQDTSGSCYISGIYVGENMTEFRRDNFGWIVRTENGSESAIYKCGVHGPRDCVMHHGTVRIVNEQNDVLAERVGDQFDCAMCLDGKWAWHGDKFVGVPDEYVRVVRCFASTYVLWNGADRVCSVNARGHIESTLPFVPAAVVATSSSSAVLLISQWGERVYFTYNVRA